MFLNYSVITWSQFYLHSIYIRILFLIKQAFEDSDRESIEKMMLFVLAILVLVFAITANFLQTFKKSRVLLMSSLAILMIMINFINEVDIVVSPPQVIVNVESQRQRQQHRKLKRLIFSKQFQQDKMINFQEQVQLIHQQMGLFQSTASQSKISLKQLQQKLRPGCRLGPITKEQVYLMGLFKDKLVQGQDWVVKVSGIQKARFESLMGWYIEQMNEKGSSYGLKAQNIVMTAIYQSEQDRLMNPKYKMPQKPPNFDYHYIVVFNKPSQQLLKFMFQSYIQSQPPYLSIVFLNLRQNLHITPNLYISPIYPFLQQIKFTTDFNYLQPILDYLHQRTPEDKQNKQLKLNNKPKRQYQKQIQREVQICQKYVEMDYAMFLKVIANNGIRTVAELCYQRTVKYPTKQIQCLRNMIKNEEQQIPYDEARMCWINQREPQNLKIKDGKVKLKKQDYWSRKLAPINFGLQRIIIQNCSIQL